LDACQPTLQNQLPANPTPWDFDSRYGGLAGIILKTIALGDDKPA